MARNDEKWNSEAWTDTEDGAHGELSSVSGDLEQGFKRPVQSGSGNRLRVKPLIGWDRDPYMSQDF